MADRPVFSFERAFDRNLGWLTEWEQQSLRGKRVAIAGMGGVGGFHLLTMARLGIGAFTIADLDSFEIENFNRQIGATMQTVGRPKAEVLAEMARGINPEVDLRVLSHGVGDADVDAFLAGADLFVDGFDFFVLGIRRKVFARCRELGIPAVTAAPVGMGVGLLTFAPDGMSFEDYFQFEGKTELQQYVNFLLGVVPKAIHRSYLVDPGRLDFGRKRAPSTVVGCQLCASAVGATAVKLLLRRGEVRPAPFHHHYDAYLGKLVLTRLRWGNAGPLQRLKAQAVEKQFQNMLQRGQTPPAAWRAQSTIEEILAIARWAPSGDNAQPWRFELMGEDRVRVRIKNDSASNVYEYRDGEPTLLSAGILLESIRIAASAFQRDMTWRYAGVSDGDYVIDIGLNPTTAAATDPLYSYLPVRSVDRWPYRRKPLTAEQKEMLAESLRGSPVSITWYESSRRRWDWARASGKATDIRLRIKEAFAVHQRILDWNQRYSPAGIPAPAIGLDAQTLRIMRWAMKEWPRANLLNRLTGTFAPRLQMDYAPGYCSAAYFSLRLEAAGDAASRTENLLRAGQAIQRFWLTATKLGLAMQPCLAVLAFAHYGRTAAPFTADASARRASVRLADYLDRISGERGDIVFAARIGWPKPKRSNSRSTRLPLPDLMKKPA